MSMFRTKEVRCRRSKMRVFHASLQISITVILGCCCSWKCHAWPNCSDAACGAFSNITYPFGLANSGCGHPDFQIQCLDNRPLLTVNNQKYRILGYKNDSILVADDRVFSDCGMPYASLDLTGTPFNLFDPSLPNLTLLFGCKMDLLPSFPLMTVLCNTTWVVSFPSLSSFNGDCKSIVRVPILGGMPIMRGIRLPSMTDIWLLLRRGFGIQWNENGEMFANCRDCMSSHGICGYNNSDSGSPFLCYRPGKASYGDGSNGFSGNEDVPAGFSGNEGVPASRGGGGKSHTGILAGASVGFVLATAVAITAIVRQRRRRVYRLTKLNTLRGVFSGDDSNGAELALPSNRIGVPLFSYEELKEATGYFDEKRGIGDGGFGCVYLGRLGDGRQVAVKRMYEDNCRRLEQFDNEVRILSSLSHPNLVRLIGYCQERRELLLVFEYVPNGTLADHLHGDLKGEWLSWETRLNIAMETAVALSYLHFCVKPPIFHRDVKSSNILLDENFSAKVADFGLSRLAPWDATHVSTAPQGTPGYLDPDYHQCYRLTDKSDVYSFGVVLAEIISAQKAVDMNRNERDIRLANLAISKIQAGALHEFVDSRLEMESNPGVKAMVHGVAELAFRCLASEKDDRPNMMEVVALLQQIKEIGYGCAQDHHVNSQKLETCKLLSGTPPYSPASVQVKWPSTNTTPDSSA